jgi:DNA-binding transcriptional ArsR family regulator
VPADPPAKLRELLMAPLDPVLSDASRFRVMAALVGLPDEGRLSFTTLRKLLNMTDGNLGQHVSVLREVGYVDTLKSATGRRVQSLFGPTQEGRAAFERHAQMLEAIIAAAGRGE